MNPSEAAQLLAHCAAFDNRTVGKADSRAWAAALHDVPLDADALAAVARFYGTPTDKPGERLWIQPHNVRAHRFAIRKERLGETLPAYEPPPGLETGAEFIARRRAQLDAVATGRIPTTPVGELTGGPAPEVARKLAGIGRRVAAVTPEELAAEIALEEGEEPVTPEVEQVRRPGPLGVVCPACHAAIGRPCKVGVPGDLRRPRVLKRPHAARARVATGGPAELESPEVIERRRAASLARLEQIAANEQAAREEAAGE
ncbi:zinc finger domain-containing protein [Streptomyces sp. LZ34]